MKPIRAFLLHFREDLLSTCFSCLPRGFDPETLGGSRFFHCRLLQTRCSGRRCAGSASSVSQSSYLWSLEGATPHKQEDQRISLDGCCCKTHRTGIQLFRSGHDCPLLTIINISTMQLITASQLNRIIRSIFYIWSLYRSLWTHFTRISKLLCSLNNLELIITLYR